MNAAKWCEHCQKNTHDDAECWSTRAMQSINPTSPAQWAGKLILMSLAIRAALWQLEPK